MFYILYVHLSSLDLYQGSDQPEIQMSVRRRGKHKKSAACLQHFPDQWCRMAELNCPLILTMDVYYHYTNPALPIYNSNSFGRYQ